MTDSPATDSPADRAKRAAAAAALDLVTPGMRLGLGTGSTAAVFVRLLGERVAAGLDVRCVATSSRTTRLAGDCGIRLTDLDALGRLDLTLDGADEFDGDLSLIKGGGGALLQEKIVAAASDRLIVLADPSKRVERLGAYPLPVEVVRFGWSVTRTAIEALLAPFDVATREVVLRRTGDAAFVTDEGHHILDLHLGHIGDPKALASALKALPGVVDHGLFIGMAERVLLGDPDGGARTILPQAFSRAEFVAAEMRSLDA